ncbi:MAG TPA: hypothetical protein VFA18_21490 [Gemmataceae bacterium]|nr:hypothetical protein [Gemmataceae bacterium]
MSTRRSWQVLLLVATLALVPATAWGQDNVWGEDLIVRAQNMTDQQPYAPPDTQFPLPLYSNRPEQGGLFVAGEFIFAKQNRQLDHQLIAVRGIVDVDGSITGVPGNFLGSGRPALYADQASGPGSYQPGFDVTIGWKFANGVAVELNWWHLQEARYNGEAALLPPTFSVGPLAADSFLFSPVFNVPPEFSGPPNKLPPGVGLPNAAFGIWNGAEVETIQFLQRFDQYELLARIPIFDTTCIHTYGLLGARMAWFWEKFWWRTQDFAFDGSQSPIWAADYTNVVSNKMYGATIGCGTDWRLGDTPIGTFAISLDTTVSGYADFVTERVQYELTDRSTSARRVRKDLRPVPEGQADINLWWYPIEGVQLRLGFDAMAFFNTAASPDPVSFDFGGLDPGWIHKFRYLGGLHAGVAFIF